ncbi:uncharacterized protein LOC135216031 isoform X1 [Macrobrachium nipponense]|uniref:uncharacterized protein LOC135216031 isoform X1 n=1 Tax=Macrobrachium nipponense TaxID=159736 RepID=UPI0030C82D7F
MLARRKGMSEGGRVYRMTALSTRATSASRVKDQAPVSLAKRTQRAQVVFYGFVTRVYKKDGRETYPAEFFIVNVFKGANIIAKLLGVNGGYGGVSNLRDKRINVTNFGPMESCMAPLKEQRTFIILANARNGRHLRAHYDYPGSAAVQWSKENEEEVWRALGWDGWSDWSGCSASCGSGTQERRRYCLKPEGCHGYNTERRRCNFFSCNGTLDVLHLPDKQYKPPKFGWRESSTRPGSWRAVKNRPLLVHTKDIFPDGFPKEFSILITIRPDLGNMGMLFIMHRAYEGEVYLGLGLGSGLELLHTGPTTPDDVLQINVAPINVNLTDGHWHQLAISVMEDNAIQVYVDCRWISRQVLRRSTLEIPMDTLLYVGGMPGRSYEGEMEQFIISRSSDAVAKQCKPEPIPIIDETLQDTGRPLGLVMQQEQNNHIFPVVHHPYNGGASEEYDYDHYDEGGDYEGEYDNDGEEYDDVGPDSYDNYPNYVYDDYGDFEGDRIPGTSDWESPPSTYVEEVEAQSAENGAEEDRRSEMKEMPGKGTEGEEAEEKGAHFETGIPAASSGATDDEDLIEGSGVLEGNGRFVLTWSVWSGCSTSCDGGVRIRSFRCLPGQVNLEECVHSGIETQEQKACNLQPCPSTTPVSHLPTTTTESPTTPTTPPVLADTESPSPTLWDPPEEARVQYQKEIMMQNIPYVTTTNVILPSVTTSDNGRPLGSVVTSPAPPPIVMTTPKHVQMHPLFPTTVINAGGPMEPVQERNYVNDTQRFYSETKPLKPLKSDLSASKSVWQPQVGRDLNEVMPPGERPSATAKKTASSWNRKWSYHYHHQHRMRHHHTKHQFMQNERECGGGCLNGGVCVYGGVCHCRGGWRGRRCEQADCGRGCMNGGVCIAPDTCRCPHGYTGTYCHDAVCSPSCANGGTCIIPGLCACPSGFLPPACTPMCTKRCLHGGMCTGVDMCTCPSGYSGPRCESAVCTPHCQHGGRCVAPGVCSCTAGYGGPICQRPVCRPPCQNGGACVAPYRCRCPNGTFGSYCQNFLCSHGCGVGGVCIGVERCRCGIGYTGPTCSIPVCDPPCSNGGTCVSPGVCSCPEGYSGLWCTVKKCKYVPKQVAYTRSYKKVVPQRVQTHCGAWGWKSCTSVRQVYQTVTQKFYRTVYTCSNSP